MSTGNPTIRWLFEILRRRVRGDSAPPIPPADVDEQAFAALVRLNRLEPLMGPESATTEFREAYERCLMQALLHLQAGVRLAGELEKNGIPCIATRGPFFGAGLYGDAGLRFFTDLDLLVPKRSRESALLIAESLGFTMRYSPMPRWFFRRHHLHWPLEQGGSGIHCDMHWAADHPYKLLRIDYHQIFERSRRVDHDGFIWREPCPEHQLLLAAVHLAKECRDLGVRTPSAEAVAVSGRLTPWLDLALILARNGNTIHWDEVRQTAESWFISPQFEHALQGAADLFGAPVPDVTLAHGPIAETRSEIRPAFVRSRWANRMGEIGGFRGSCIADAVPFLWPPRRYFGNRGGVSAAFGRAGHFVCALTRLTAAGLDAVICQAVVAVRRRMERRRLPVLLLVCALAFAPLSVVADDGPGSVTPVAVNGSAVDGNIGADVEKDWFSFSAAPYASYALSVTTGTVWDCEVELRTPDGVVELSESSTVYGASSGTLRWTNRVAGGTFYIRVGGFAEFTTGSYQVVVSGGTFTDANANGLPDIWEVQEFGNLTNTAENDNDGDGLSNKDEYQAGTHPTNSASGLFAESFQHHSNQFSLAWQAIQYGTYRILLATNLVNGSSWRVLGTNLNTDGSGLESYVDPDGSLPQAFYRVEYVY